MSTTDGRSRVDAGADHLDVVVRSDVPVVHAPTHNPVVAEPGRGVRAARWLVHLFQRNWFIELAVFLVLVVAYNVVRSMPDITPSLAVRHAHAILDLEGALFDHVEFPLNQWIVGVPSVAIAACYVYAIFHYFATPVIFFLSRHRGGWQYWRGYWALVLASAFALVGYALYPVAPPRLVPNLDIVDVMRSFAGYGWWGSAASAPRGIGDATNQFAAMPSMHLGWALWCAIQMWGFGSTIWRLLAVVYPAVLSFAVLATGNHFVLDIIGGVACVLVAYGLVQLAGIAARRTGVVRHKPPAIAPTG